ncbi:hypothetical protein [Candidatus Vidania fulgoroideorum]
MAKRSVIERNRTRNCIRIDKGIYKDRTIGRWSVLKYFNVRRRRRCGLSGRSRGVFRMFGICRQMVREAFQACELPYFSKLSW